uniref:Uncharacterized protein n=1 Tax=Schistosoma haematobium TaxID=6185 RepID=A0A095C401_SCHHA
MKIKNNSIHHNDHDINNNEKSLIHLIDKTNHDNQLQEESKKSINQQLINNTINNNKHSIIINNNNNWSISEIGLSLSCLNPNDNYNILYSSSNSLSLLSYSSYLSPFNINPFPYIINLQKNNIDFNLNQQINKQILLQIGSYHLPELIRYIQSKKSIWCLQKLNISGPFYNLYFPLIYDLQFSTYLLTLINNLKFSNIIKLIICDLPEIEILNRARIRSHRNQYVKYYINNNNNNHNVRKDIRFSHPSTLSIDNHPQQQHQQQHHHHNNNRHDESCKTSIEFISSKDNLLSLSHLPHIINVSNIDSNENIKIKRNSQDFINFYGIKQSNRKYHSLDVQQIFSSTDLYTNLQCQEITDNKLITKSNNENSTDFTSNGLQTMNLIETANCVQSRRRTRKPELIFMKQSNHMDSTTVSPPKNEELCLNKETVIRISNSNHQDKNETNSEISNQFETCPRSVNDQNYLKSFQNNSPIPENNKIQVTKISTINQNDLSESSLSTLNPDSNKTNDLSLNNSLNSNVDTTFHIPVKWRRAKTEKIHSHCNTDARIITIRRRLQSAGTNTWNTKLHDNTTFSKLEQSRSNNLTEQSRRNRLANMCADLLEENRKLRNDQSDNMNKQTEQQMVTTNTSTSLMNQPNEPIYKNYKGKKVKLSFINGKIKQISSNPSIWRKSKVKSPSFNNETDL